MTQIGSYIYEIDEENAVRVWDASAKANGDAPFLYQPFDPNGGVVFSSHDSAESWVSEYIQSLIDINSTPPEQPLIPEENI